MVVVSVRQGSLRGKEIQLVTGKKALAFKGIPFAKPPVGNLRFKAPVPIDNWEGTRDAFEHGSVCFQKNESNNNLVIGSEDCLYLNVYTPSVPDSRNKSYPVMVLIHGGGFYLGSGNSDVYGPDFLIDNDVILVTINYRLEVFGFLCLNTPEVPGNAGMKDQLLAMKWVKDNIESFGGDSNNITIFGESAGSVSVTLHYVSPASRGYFHKAIAQSGSCTEGWAVQTRPVEAARQICRHLGNDTEDVDEILNFLQTVEAAKLVNIGSVVAFSDDRLGDNLQLVPVIENNFNDPSQFIVEPVTALIQKSVFSKVPLMIGHTSSEGIIFSAATAKLINAHIENPKNFVPSRIRRVTADVEAEAIGNRIKQFYFGETNPTAEDIDDIVKFDSDLMFNYSIRQLADLVAARSSAPVYFYNFLCESERNIFKALFKLPEAKGVSHADDLPYLFHMSILPHLNEVDLNSRTGRMIRQVCKLWTNFAAKSDPTPDNSSEVTWPPYTSTDKYYLEIDETLSVRQKPDQEMVEFWDVIYQQAGIPTAATL